MPLPGESGGGVARQAFPGQPALPNPDLLSRLHPLLQGHALSTMGRTDTFRPLDQRAEMLQRGQGLIAEHPFRHILGTGFASSLPPILAGTVAIPPSLRAFSKLYQSVAQKAGHQAQQSATDLIILGLHPQFRVFNPFPAAKDGHGAMKLIENDVRQSLANSRFPDTRKIGPAIVSQILPRDISKLPPASKEVMNALVNETNPETLRKLMKGRFQTFSRSLDVAVSGNLFAVRAQRALQMLQRNKWPVLLGSALLGTAYLGAKSLANVHRTLKTPNEALQQQLEMADIQRAARSGRLLPSNAVFQAALAVSGQG